MCIKHSNLRLSERFSCICEVAKSFDLAFRKLKEKQNAKVLACTKPESLRIFRCYVSYTSRCASAKIKRITSKSIEQLENNVWETPNEFLTDLIKRCYEYRKISIAQLTTEQMRLLISQKI